MTPPDQPLWVFAYGSLMWRPGFRYADVQRARLTGWHRRFCIVSRHHRGNDRYPGLVLGLARGGVTEGLAFSVASNDVRDVLRYLKAREQIGGVYREARLPVTLHAEAAADVRALAFIAEPCHPSFVLKRLSVERQAAIIKGARGISGTNIGYLAGTIDKLRRLGIKEPELERIMSCVGTIRGRLPLNEHPLAKFEASCRPAGWPPRPRTVRGSLTRFHHRIKRR